MRRKGFFHRLRNLLSRLVAGGGGAPSRGDVLIAFRALLDREPENERAIAYHQTHETVADLYTEIARSAEYTSKSKSSPYFHLNASIDAAKVITAHDYPARVAMEGHVVNVLGVAMNVDFMSAARHLAGMVEEVPIPANWHADMAEWAAALRAVDLARGEFTVLELGCGWGCWMINTAVAARRRGLAVHAIGVEGDASHVEFAREAFATNGIPASQYTLLRGVAASSPGVALFPKSDRKGARWDSEPVFNPSPDVLSRSLATLRFDRVEIVPLADVIGDRKRVDLLHIDIQGGEARLVRECRKVLAERVAYLVIGTHSRQIEGELFETLLADGWVLEVERPAILKLADGAPETDSDGVQGWRNPRLAED